MYNELASIVAASGSLESDASGRLSLHPQTAPRIVDSGSKDRPELSTYLPP